MAHATHAMTHTAHPMRSMEARMCRSKARAVIDTSCRRHSTTVAAAHVRSASPMNAAALGMDGLRVLRMQGCLA